MGKDGYWREKFERVDDDLKNTRIYHKKLEHNRDAKVRKELNSIGKSPNSIAGSSSNSSKNPYSEKPKDNSLTKTFSKNSQKGEKTPAKHDTVTTGQTKRGRMDSQSSPHCPHCPIKHFLKREPSDRGTRPVNY